MAWGSSLSLRINVGAPLLLLPTVPHPPLLLPITRRMFGQIMIIQRLFSLHLISQAPSPTVFDISEHVLREGQYPCCPTFGTSLLSPYAGEMAQLTGCHLSARPNDRGNNWLLKSLIGGRKWNYIDGWPNMGDRLRIYRYRTRAESSRKPLGTK